jgi:hypothetical protein
MARQLDPQAPLLVIGTGRSGSTLLMRVLQAHPDISFKGETSFLVPRLWKECFENRFWHNWPRYYALNPNSAFEPLQPLSDNERRKLEQDVGGQLAKFICDLLHVRRAAQVWGYKELWNGGRSYNFDWSIYDSVFPRATWVHLVRNPFSFARSTARWNRYPLDLNYLDDLLHEWVAIVRRSRERAASGRYFELRYEDLVANARTSLAPVLKSLGLKWHEACEAAVGAHVFASAGPTYGVFGTLAPDIKYYGSRIEGLAELAMDLNYESVPLEIELRPSEIDTATTKL